jgi:hypothetical protein
MSSMNKSETYDSIRLIVAMPPRHFFGGNDRENALTIVESLRLIFPKIFLFDCDIYLSGSDTEFAAHLKAAEAFRPDVGLALPNSTYALMLNSRELPAGRNRLREFLRLPEKRPPLGNVFADKLDVPTIMLWDHLITQAPSFLLGHPLVPRQESLPGSLEKLRSGLNHKNFLHYVPDSGHIEVFERFGVWERGSVRKYVVPGHNLFLTDPSEPPSGLITDRVLFAGNLSSGNSMSAFGDDQVVREVKDYVTSVKCKEWGTAAWRAYEEIASQMVAAGVTELHPDHSFFWSLGRPLTGEVALTAFRTTVFKSVASPIDFYGGFTDPEFVSDLGGSGLFNAMGSVPFKSLGEIYARYRFSIDVTHTPFIHGSNAKVLNCFAAGGFMFVDWREDLHQELGVLAEQFMYRNAEELNSKMERLSANPAERREIIQAMRARISDDLNFLAFLSGALREAAQSASR